MPWPLNLAWFCFNTQPPEGGWGSNSFPSNAHVCVSTHSHPKVAGDHNGSINIDGKVSTHSHPKVAGKAYLSHRVYPRVSTHSHPKVAGTGRRIHIYIHTVSTHSHPKVAGWEDYINHREKVVSTHSHPKVAGRKTPRTHSTRCSFNTQPPEGGWMMYRFEKVGKTMFQHAAARRRLTILLSVFNIKKEFQHAAARRRLNFVDIDMSSSVGVSTRSRPKAAERFYFCVFS